MLLWTSLVGSLIGFVVCYQLFVKLQLVENRFNMRICMLNSMSLAFIFAMLIELTTGSKGLAVLIPIVSICLPILGFTKFNLVDTVEASIATLMSVSMSIMLIGMTDPIVILIIQGVLVLVEASLGFIVLSRIHAS